MIMEEGNYLVVGGVGEKDTILEMGKNLLLEKNISVFHPSTVFLACGNRSNGVERVVLKREKARESYIHKLGNLWQRPAVLLEGASMVQHFNDNRLDLQGIEVDPLH